MFRWMIVLVSFVLIAPMAAAERWEFVSHEALSRPAGGDVAVVHSANRYVAIMLSTDAPNYVLQVKMRRPDSPQGLLVIVTDQGDETEVYIPSHNVFSAEAPSGYGVASFAIRSHLLEKVMAGSSIFVKYGRDQHEFSLSGSRTAIERLMAVTEPHRMGLEEEQIHTNGQTISDCDQAAAHPQDPFRRAGGTPWNRLNPDGAVPVCREAVEVADGADLGRMLYQYGRALEKAEDRDAIFVLRRAGDEHGYPMALYHLAILHERGENRAKDLETAERYYRRAIERNVLPARHNLARMLVIGSDQSRHPEGWAMMKENADLGFALSQEYIALRILDETLPDRDILEAIRLLQAASEGGRARSSYTLSQLYKTGRGVDLSPETYLGYLRKAAAQGSAQARKELNGE